MKHFLPVRNSDALSAQQVGLLVNKVQKSVRRLQVNAFIVRKGSKGLRTSKIENKIALRCVQNADIFLDDCFVPDSARLPGVNSFKVRIWLHVGSTQDALKSDAWLAHACCVAYATRGCSSAGLLQRCL